MDLDMKSKESLYSLTDVEDHFFESSILSYLSVSKRREILPKLKMYEFRKGEEVSKYFSTLDIVIIYSGEIDLHRKYINSNFTNSIRKKGRSIELRSVLDHLPEWEYFWVAHTPIELVTFPFSDFYSALDQETYIIQALSRTSKFPGLRPFIRDLKLLGIDQKSISKIASSLDLESRPWLSSRLENIASQDVASDINGLRTNGLAPENSGLKKTANSPLLVIIETGSLILRYAGEELDLFVEKLSPGAYQILYLDRYNIEFPDEDHFTFWVITLDKLSSILNASDFQTFMGVLSTYHKKPVLPKKSPDIFLPFFPGGSEDGLEIEDFERPKETSFGSIKRLFKRPILIHQHDTMDCGAACLASIAAFYGNNIGLRYYRSIVEINKDGASMLAVKSGAEKTGFLAIGAYCGFEKLQSLILPCIALCRYHYVIIYAIKKNKVLIGDPAVGLQWMDREEFSKYWSRYCVLLKPTAELFKVSKESLLLTKYFSIFKGLRAYWIESLMVLLILFCVETAAPFIGLLFFDSLHQSKDQKSMNIILLIVVSSMGIGVLLRWMHGHLTNYLTSLIDAKMSTQFVHHIFRLPQNFFWSRNVGDFTSRLNAIEIVRDILRTTVVQGSVSLVSAFFFVFLLFLFSYKIAALLCILTALIAAILIYSHKKMMTDFRQIEVYDGLVYSQIFEQFRHPSILRDLDAGRVARMRWMERIDKLLHHYGKTSNRGTAIAAIISILEGLTSLAILVFAIVLYMRSALSIGQVFAINLIANRVMQPIIFFANNATKFTQFSMALSRIDDFFTASTENKIFKNPDLKTFGSIEFRNVSYRYGGDLSPAILNNISFKIDSNEIIGIVGGSGSGKSTLVHLLAGILDPVEGEILFGDTGSRDVSLQSIRKSISVVWQNQELMNDSIFNNIALGDIHAKPENVIAAAKLAEAHQFIMEKPGGYHCTVGDQGVGLSGGEIQRINIARAIYHRSKILILDEATSNLDAVNEEKILSNILSTKELTIIIIAHRLRSIARSHRIFVLHDGRLAETGNHLQLISRRGIYFELFHEQVLAGR